MHLEVNGTRLWFDVDGEGLVPDGPRMRRRPTVLLIHGGPGSYDHSYFKPDFGRLARLAQVIYLDLRDHGLSARHDPADWTFEICADDVRAFCDELGISKPIVYGHSMGGFVAMLYGARHPGHAEALILQSTCARWDTPRLVEAVRGVAGDEVAELARRSYGGDPVTDDEWARVFVAFGPNVPDPEQLSRRIANGEVNDRAAKLFDGFDVVDRLAAIGCPTLVSVGALDPITPVAAAQEIVDALAPGVGRLEVMPGMGHFPWLDAPDGYWPVIEAFVGDPARARPT